MGSRLRWRGIKCNEHNFTIGKMSYKLGIREHWAHTTHDEDKQNRELKKDEQHGTHQKRGGGVNPGARKGQLLPLMRHTQC